MKRRTGKPEMFRSVLQVVKKKKVVDLDANKLNEEDDVNFYLKMEKRAGRGIGGGGSSFTRRARQRRRPPETARAETRRVRPRVATRRVYVPSVMDRIAYVRTIQQMKLRNTKGTAWALHGHVWNPAASTRLRGRFLGRSHR